MAPLRYAAKFDPFCSLDCAPTHALQGREGIKFCYLATLERMTMSRKAVKKGHRSKVMGEGRESPFFAVCGSCFATSLPRAHESIKLVEIEFIRVRIYSVKSDIK